MATARAAGFKVELAFILLRSSDLHVARVRTRVAYGGHDIPTATILRRYDRTLANLPAAIRLADQVIIYDNTAEPRVLCRMEGHAILFDDLNEADPFHLRIASLIGEGLGISVDAVFRSASRDS